MVTRREGMIPRLKEEGAWIRLRMCGDFGEFALDLSTELIKVQIIRIVSKGVLTIDEKKYDQCLFLEKKY